MKTFFGSIFAVALFAMSGTSAQAQPAPDVNCAALSNSPFMCIKNAANSPVVAVQASSSNMFSPTRWINIPGGAILPGGTAIVKFDAWSGGCNQFVSIRMASGQTHTYPYINVCSSTSFLVRGW